MLKNFNNILFYLISLFVLSIVNVDTLYAKNGIFSYGIIGGIDGIKNGAGFEFGFGLFRNTKIDFRNYITITGYALNNAQNIPGMNGISMFTLSDKLMLGKALFIRGRVVRPYGFIGAGFGAFDKPNTFIDKFEGPYYYELFAGAGVDLRIDRKTTFFVEGSLVSSNITNSKNRLYSYPNEFNSWKNTFDKGYFKANLGIRFFF